MERILSIRKGGAVKRFHTITMLKENTVAAHSWGVATLILEVYPQASLPLIKAALYHDVAEHITGDVSAPTKWRYPELRDALRRVEEEVEHSLGINEGRKLDETERDVLKFCDMADLVLTCLSEYRLGNRDAMEIVQRGVSYLEDNSWTPGCRTYLQKLKAHVKEIK